MKVQQATKKRVTVEYVQVPVYDPTDDTQLDYTHEILLVAKWCKGHVCNLAGHGYIEIKTLEGTMRADEGDYIICGVQGEFYPCKPDIFHATYDRVNDA